MLAFKTLGAFLCRSQIPLAAFYILLLLRLLALPVLAQSQTPAPVLFYSDIDSGPATGGEGGTDGAFLCVYGEHFGYLDGINPPGGASLSVGGYNLVNFKVWTDPVAQETATQYLPGYYAKACGQISHLTPTGAQTIKLTTPQGSSNTVPFTIRPGAIHFVATAGSDNNPGTSSSPWQTTAKCRKALQPGDICYLETMTLSTIDSYGILWLNTSGTAGYPIAIAAYPGAAVELNGDTAPAVSFAVRNFPAGAGSYWTLAGMTLNGYMSAFDLTGLTHIRIIDNDVMCTGAACVDLAAGFVAGGSSSKAFDHAQLYGNRFHDIGCSDLDSSADYLNYASTPSPHPCTWNNGGSITIASSGTQMTISGTPTGWSAPDVIQAGSQLRRPVSAAGGSCTESGTSDGMGFPNCCTLNSSNGTWSCTLDSPFQPDLPAGTPWQFRLYAPAKTEHNVYFGAYVYYLDFGWNEIDGSKGNACRGLQLYHDGSPNNHDILIHDNYIHDTVCDGINLADVDPTNGPVAIYNNILYNDGRGVSDVIGDLPGGGANYACLYLSGAGESAGSSYGAQADQISVFNNTMVNCGTNAHPQYPTSMGSIAHGIDFHDDNVQLTLTNNILVQMQTPAQPYILNYDQNGIVNGSHNDCYDSNNNSCPIGLDDSYSLQPFLVGVPDFHLQLDSPLAYIPLSQPMSVTDLDGQLRSYTSSLGAYTISHNVLPVQLTVSGGTFPYNGNAHAASCSASSGGTSVPGSCTYSYVPGGTTVPTAAGTYTVNATFTPADTMDYTGASGSASLLITQATPALALICAVPYDGSPHSCTGLATGIGGATVSGSWSFSPASEIQIGSYPATGTFTSSDPNYVSGTASGTLQIYAGAPALTLNCPEVAYDGNVHSCTGSATNGNGAAISGSWSLSPASVTSAGNNPVLGVFTSSDPNYVSGTASGVLKIDAATPALALNCPEVNYDGNAHFCTGSATGIGGVTITGSWSFSPASETAAGSYSVTGSFISSNTNYASGRTATGTLKIDGVPVTTVPTPTITRVAPAMTTAGSQAFAFTVFGANFASNAVIEWNGAPLATTANSDGSLSASVGAVELTTAGTANVTVFNPASGTNGTTTSPVFEIAINSSGSTGGTVTTTSAQVTVQPGSSTNVPVIVSGAASTTVTSATCVNLPAGASCTYNNGTVVITAGPTTPAGTYYITIIVTTTQMVSSLFHPGALYAAWSGIMGLPLGLLWMGSTRKKTLRRLLLALPGLLLLFSLAGCGGAVNKAQPAANSTAAAQSSIAVTLTIGQ